MEGNKEGNFTIRDGLGQIKEATGIAPDTWTKWWRRLKVLACLILAGMVVFTTISAVSKQYNQMVDADLQVQNAAGNVQTDLERRVDLLPNLAATTQGSANFEYKTMVDTILARSGHTEKELADARQRISNAAPVEVAAGTGKSTTADELMMTQLLGNFVKLQENYPTLQSTQQFRELSAQVTATENQILVDRQTYNAAVRQYKSITTSWPSVLISGYLGYPPSKYDMYVPPDKTRAETVPTLTFNMTTIY
jgi:LemA protein